jgi:hypothetical protein
VTTPTVQVWHVEAVTMVEVEAPASITLDAADGHCPTARRALSVTPGDPAPRPRSLPCRSPAA